MAKRVALSKLKGRRIVEIKMTSNRHFIEFISKSGNVIFSVQNDHIFDKDGNYFDNDID